VLVVLFRTDVNGPQRVILRERWGRETEREEREKEEYFRRLTVSASMWVSGKKLEKQSEQEERERKREISRVERARETERERKRERVERRERGERERAERCRVS
jgi:hypothetical protein